MDWKGNLHLLVRRDWKYPFNFSDLYCCRHAFHSAVSTRIFSFTVKKRLLQDNPAFIPGFYCMVPVLPCSALQCMVTLNNFDWLFLFRTAVIFVAYFKFVTLLHSAGIFIFYVKKLTCRCLKERICAWKKLPSPSLPCKLSGNSR